MACKLGARRTGAPFEDWLLPRATERVQRKLEAAPDGLPTFEAACAEAVREGIHSSVVILNIFARQRDPGPPATIVTPDALRLTHEPTT